MLNNTIQITVICWLFSVALFELIMIKCLQNGVRKCTPQNATLSYNRLSNWPHILVSQKAEQLSPAGETGWHTPSLLRGSSSNSRQIFFPPPPSSPFASHPSTFTSLLFPYYLHFPSPFPTCWPSHWRLDKLVKSLPVCLVLSQVSQAKESITVLHRPFLVFLTTHPPSSHPSTYSHLWWPPDKLVKLLSTYVLFY